MRHLLITLLMVVYLPFMAYTDDTAPVVAPLTGRYIVLSGRDWVQVFCASGTPSAMTIGGALLVHCGVDSAPQ